jgi:pimeloyl-ACP methyl ester carboxylesterase
MTATETAPQRLRDDSGRARLPDMSGMAVASDGVRIAYDVYGRGSPTLVLLPSAPIIHSRQWKGQVPYLSRSYRVVTYDGRGNGRSDRPTDPASYHDDRYVGDLEAVMDATGTHRAVLVGLCGDGVWRSIRFAAREPGRVLGIVAFAVGVPRLGPAQPHYVSAAASFDEELPTTEGWAKYNRHHWERDYPDFARFFFDQMTTEPHSTKAREDAAGWAVDGSVGAMLADAEVDFPFDLEAIEGICRSVSCPMLLVHGTEDRCQPIERARRLAEITGAPLVVVEGANHMIPGRHPVLANLLIRDFVRSLKESDHAGT